MRSQNGQNLVTNAWHTCEFRQYCHVGNRAQQCRLGLFQDSDVAGDLEDSKSTSGGILCIFGSRTFVPISWMCKKQTPVSHSSTEAEVISLDAGLRMGGVPALDLWHLVIEVFHSSPNQTNKTKDAREPRGHLSAKTQPNMRNQIPTKHINLDLTNVDHVSLNVKPSDSNATLSVFEDNEAVIKMIIKGRSPTMRHVSRTHRVALDWLFDGINLDPKIKIRYIDTKHQLADILTKGNFTRDEWNNLIHLFTISHFSFTCCAQNSSLMNCIKTIAKRMQEHKRRRKNCGKIKAYGFAKGPIASKSPGILRASGKLDARERRNSKSDAPARLQDARLGGLINRVAGKLAATEKSQESWRFLNPNPGAITRKK